MATASSHSHILAISTAALQNFRSFLTDQDLRVPLCLEPNLWSTSRKPNLIPNFSWSLFYFCPVSSTLLFCCILYISVRYTKSFLEWERKNWENCTSSCTAFNRNKLLFNNYFLTVRSCVRPSFSGINQWTKSKDLCACLIYVPVR